jgi:hypothetical protein
MVDKWGWARNIPFVIYPGSSAAEDNVDRFFFTAFKLFDWNAVGPDWEGAMNANTPSGDVVRAHEARGKAYLTSALETIRVLIVVVYNSNRRKGEGR